MKLRVFQPSGFIARLRVPQPMMLQIIIWMLCIYLLLKGAELVLVALNAPPDRRTASAIISTIFGVAAWLAAIFFFLIANEQVRDMPAAPPSPFYRQ